MVDEHPLTGAELGCEWAEAELDQAVLDWQVVGHTTDESGDRKVDVVAVAARRDMIAQARLDGQSEREELHSSGARASRLTKGSSSTRGEPGMV